MAKKKKTKTKRLVPMTPKAGISKTRRRFEDGGSLKK